jgi:hypothetical protein
MLCKGRAMSNNNDNDNDNKRLMESNKSFENSISINSRGSGLHEFHIPVMGTAFTIDTPYKVARFGISSVVSIGDDELCESMRQYYSNYYGLNFHPITKKEDSDYRAKRITAYLDLLDDLITKQINSMKTTPFKDDSDNTKFFDLLPPNHKMKLLFNEMLVAKGDKKKVLELECKNFIQPGSIDVNIMTKLDRDNYDNNNRPLSDQFSDAISALRGFANSKIQAGIVFSAGFNRRLFAYCEHIKDFYWNNNKFRKQLILKVSDFRSSIIQGRFLAKKGIFVSEYRIESGLNCGGHAFATDGLLCGPILEEFKKNKQMLDDECRNICNEVLKKKSFNLIPPTVMSKITYQGGIGSATEQEFLMSYYKTASTGWATPFLLVPEVTTLDMATRTLLKNATKSECYLSEISPLGVPFNTVRDTESERQKLDRVASGRPGSPCPKGYLVFDTEFSKKPVCKASMFYQKRKIDQLKKLNLVSDEYQSEFNKIIDKACLCEDLAAPALISYGLINNRPLKPTVCAGPNIAYYNQIVTLKEMVDHIYGRINLISDVLRPSFFVAELNMYIKHFSNEVKRLPEKATKIDVKRLNKYVNNLFDGIQYYIDLTQNVYKESEAYKMNMLNEFKIAKATLIEIITKNKAIFDTSLAEAS